MLGSSFVDGLQTEVNIIKDLRWIDLPTPCIGDRSLPSSWICDRTIASNIDAFIVMTKLINHDIIDNSSIVKLTISHEDKRRYPIKPIRDEIIRNELQIFFFEFII